MKDFIFSKEGHEYLKDFKERFDCIFGIDEPSGENIIVDAGDLSYEIPSDESIEAFKAAVDKSMETGRNMVVERYKNNLVEYESDIDY